MAGHCEDCGCKTYGGACTNCHEEIYIYEQSQGNDEPTSFSPEFMGKVTEQSKIRAFHRKYKG